jgi:ubiquitin-activating enzyme E1-like protein
MQYRNGYFTSAAAAVTLELGFVPDKVEIINYTKTVAGSGVGDAIWINGVVASGKALIDTYTAGAPVRTLLASDGVTSFSTGADWAETQATITGATKANPCVITAASHGFSTGDTVTISNVGGMTQLNTNRYIITVVDANSFSLNDLFGNPVDSSAYGTYTSGGQANKISDTATPPGNEFDEGSAGVILGTGVVGSASDVIFWEAFFETPTGW